ncbi:MAG: hypothetical protein ABI594_15775 [Ginsengibacter sp.]
MTTPSMIGETHVLIICRKGFEWAFNIKPATNSPAIKTLETVNLEILLFLIARKYIKGAITRISISIAFDNKSLLVLNFVVRVIKKQLKNIIIGIPIATFQFGLFIIDVVIVITFYNGSLRVYLYYYPVIYFENSQQMAQSS